MTEYKDLVEGDIVVFTNNLYGSVTHMTRFKEYVLQETPVQEEWPLTNGMPFYPELKLSLLDDRGNPIKLKASRFSIKKNLEKMKD